MQVTSVYFTLISRGCCVVQGGCLIFFHLFIHCPLLPGEGSQIRLRLRTRQAGRHQAGAEVAESIPPPEKAYAGICDFRGVVLLLWHGNMGQDFRTRQACPLAAHGMGHHRVGHPHGSSDPR